jgi:hypothetical protein
MLRHRFQDVGCSTISCWSRDPKRSKEFRKMQGERHASDGLASKTRQTAHSATPGARADIGPIPVAADGHYWHSRQPIPPIFQKWRRFGGTLAHKRATTQNRLLAIPDLRQGRMPRNLHCCKATPLRMLSRSANRGLTAKSLLARNAVFPFQHPRNDDGRRIQAVSHATPRVHWPSQPDPRRTHRAEEELNAEPAWRCHAADKRPCICCVRAVWPHSAMPVIGRDFRASLDVVETHWRHHRMPANWTVLRRPTTGPAWIRAAFRAGLVAGPTGGGLRRDCLGVARLVPAADEMQGESGEEGEQLLCDKCSFAALLLAQRLDFSLLFCRAPRPNWILTLQSSISSRFLVVLCVASVSRYPQSTLL